MDKAEKPTTLCEVKGKHTWRIAYARDERLSCTSCGFSKERYLNIAFDHIGRIVHVDDPSATRILINPCLEEINIDHERAVSYSSTDTRGMGIKAVEKVRVRLTAQTFISK